MRSIQLLLAVLLLGCPADPDPVDPGPCHFDSDGDGFGHPADHEPTGAQCGDGPGEVVDGSDCDDGDAGVHPDAVEVPDDWFDQNCDGLESISCMPDRDGDGYGAPPNVVEEDGDCEEPELRPTWDFVDCDDEDAAIHTGAEEIPEDGIDQDCDGADAPLCFYDGDQDGYGAGAGQPGPGGSCEHEFLSGVGGDCDDSADWISPDGVDVPDDGWDQDCSGSDSITCLLDGDGDGSPGTDAIIDLDGECDPDRLPAWVPADCDDADPGVSPTATDVADDGIDQDCNGVDAVACFNDWDQDGYGAGDVFADADGQCADPYESPIDGDCDDGVDWIHPAAPEIAGDPFDSNCDGDPEN